MIAARTGMLLVALGVAITGASCGVPPVSGRSCAGVPESVCESQMAAAQRDAPRGAGVVVGIQVRCVVATCTEQSGEAEVVVTYASGQTLSSGMGWSQAEPAGGPAGPAAATPLPVVPVCLGVPAAWCREMAATAADGDGTSTAAIGSITVRCTGTCTPTRGEGSTLITFADGTSRTSGWSYDGDAP